MGEGGEILDLFAAETERRVRAILESCDALSSASDPVPELVESVRAEAHGLRGAASVIGEERLAELAGAIEEVAAPRIDSGELEPELIAQIRDAARALREGAAAVAANDAEPTSVEDGLSALRSR